MLIISIIILPKLSKVDQAISVLEAAARKKPLSEGQLSRIASPTGLTEQTRPMVGGALSGKKAEKQTGILAVLEKRFSEKPDHYKRPEGIVFVEVESALEANPALMASLTKMEETGGAPDMVAIENGAFIFADCSAESPSGRRILDHDHAASQAAKFGVELMKGTFYKKKFQEIGTFDSNTWNWLETPADIRRSGYALCGNRSGVDVRVSEHWVEFRSSYGGWRGVLRVPKA